MTTYIEEVIDQGGGFMEIKKKALNANIDVNGNLSFNDGSLCTKSPTKDWKIKSDDNGTLITEEIV